MKVLFAAGGTGGHLFPAIEIARELSEQGVECSFAAHGLALSEMFPHDLYPWWDIPAGRPQLSRVLSFGMTTACSTVKAGKVLAYLKPDCVIGFGSFHTFPVLLATCFRRIPLFLFEPNVAPGRVIRLFAKFATCTGVCFAEAQECIGKSSSLVSMPLLRSHTGIVTRGEALERYGLSPHTSIVVAFGGSQGSRVINEAVIQAISLFKSAERPQLLLLCGLSQDKKALEEKAKLVNVSAKVVLFEREMSYAYAAADVVVCRSGASTVAELKSFKKPAVCIPYPFAKDNHQLLNAQALLASGLAQLVKEEDITSEILQRKIAELIERDFSNISFEANREKFSQLILDQMR